jgi:hypothetical protein
VINADDPTVWPWRGGAVPSSASLRGPPRSTKALSSTRLDRQPKDRITRSTRAARRHPLIGPHLVDDVLAAATVGVLAGARPGGDDRWRRSFPASSTRWSSSRNGRRQVRERLESHQRRGGAAIDRKLSTAWCRSWVGASRAATCALLASRLRPAPGRSSRSAKPHRLLHEAFDDVVQVLDADHAGERRRAGLWPRAPARRRACWRRRARASTCFRTMPSADDASRRQSRGVVGGAK